MLQLFSALGTLGSEDLVVGAPSCPGAQLCGKSWDWWEWLRVQLGFLVSVQCHSL